MIKEVKVIDWCISCRNCETVCPNIFKVSPTSKVISNNYEWNESEILQAELMCPVNVIKVKKDWNFQLSFKNAEVLNKNLLTQDTLEITFSTENFWFKAWQYISLQMEDYKWKFSRSYSIASWNKNSFTLTVKLLKKWRWANFLNKLKIWNKVQFLWALWNFYLRNTIKSKVLVATWTGLAPMIAMLKQIPKEVEKTVIFWVRFENDIYYKDLLESFDNTKVIIKVSKPSEDYKWEIWRVTDCISKIPLDSEVYICWNPEMVESMRNWLIERWHPQELIFNESFTIKKEYPNLTKDIFINWNIPFINHFSWIVILFSLIWIPILWNFVATQTFWNISWYSVVFVMAIRPLADLFPKLWVLAKLVSLRKAFWILSSSIVITALIYKFYWNPNYIYTYFTQANFALQNPFTYPLLSRLSEITWLILLITSNTFSQKKLWIWWKRIQRLSYIYFISWWIIAALWTPLKIYPAMWIVIFLWILAAFWLKIWK